MYQFKFAAIRRTDRLSKICHLSVVANTESDARRQLVQRFVLFFCARLPVAGAIA